MIRDYWEKYKDVILYLVFGVFTTVVNIVAYWICVHILGTNVMVGTIVAWALAVFFAYVTNRSLVFHSAATGTQEIVKEIISFFACRIGTGVVDWAIMLILVTILHFNDMIVKILANFIVIVLNFVLSKFVIFKK